jgi:hypothetical protein
VDPLQQQRQDGEEQAETVHRDQACRLEPHPRRAGPGEKDQDNRRSDIINIINPYFNF